MAFTRLGSPTAVFLNAASGFACDEAKLLIL